jgi:hypothetical protein
MLCEAEFATKDIRALSQAILFPNRNTAADNEQRPQQRRFVKVSATPSGDWSCPLSTNSTK